MLTVVSDSFELSSQNATLAEKMARADTWARVLIDIIPENRLQDAFDFAFQNHSSAFPVNAYDIKLAWESIEKTEREAEKARRERELKENPVLNCEKKQFHINEHGEVHRINPFNTSEDIPVPCWYCRRDASDAAWTRFIEKNGGNEPKPLEIVEKLAEIETPVIEEVKLSDNEIYELLAEHNSLVRQIVEDEAARKNLELVFDFGGNVFKLPHRADLTFSADVVRKKIADYKRILSNHEAI